MITKLILDNFLAHGHTELDLGPGVTVISGPNNSGKSSIVEALRCMAQNPSPKFFIRHGAKEARVSVIFEDGGRVTWVRRPRYAMYEVLRPGAEEPEIYAKFGRNPPEDVLKLLRLDPVFLEAVNENVDVHIGDQRRPVFLLDRPGSAMAAFFASSTEAVHLVAMQQLLKTKAAQARRDTSKLSLSMERLLGELDVMRSLPALQLEMEQARQKANQTRIAQADIPVLATLLVKVRKQKQVSALLQGQIDKLSALVPPPEPEHVEDLLSCIAKMRGLQKEQKRLSLHIQAIKDIEPAPVLHPAKPLANMLDCQTNLYAMQAGRLLRLKGLACLHSSDKPFDIFLLDRITKQIHTLQIKFRGLVGRTSVLAALLPVGPSFDISQLSKTLSALRVADNQYQSLCGKKAVLATLLLVPSLYDVRGIAELFEAMRRSWQKKETIAKKAYVLSGLYPVPVFEDTTAGRVLSQRLGHQQGLAKRTSNRLNRIAITEKELRNRLQNIGKCPLCGGHIDVNKFFGNHHA